MMKNYLICLFIVFSSYASGQEVETKGIGLDICSSFQPSSTFISARYFFINGDNNLWMNEIGVGYNFNKIMKNSFATSFAFKESSPIMFVLGTSIDHFLTFNQSFFFISPLVRFDSGFIALEYSRKVSVGSNTSHLIYDNSITIIIRPKLLLYPFMK